MGETGGSAVGVMEYGDWDLCCLGQYRWSFLFFFFFKQKTAYEIVSRDWSSDVCSSDLKHYTYFRPSMFC